ncbi:hypothetical protein [Roseateles flavus]|uniref:Uncharacterized protein n=1 Tax=Roseateles flavus TaxID=3149041 RepID=A0ABV0GB56_9BURK
MKGLINSRIAEALRREPAHEYKPMRLYITITGSGEVINPWIAIERKNCIRDAAVAPTDWSKERRRNPSAMKFKAALLNKLSAKGQRHE